MSLTDRLDQIDNDYNLALLREKIKEKHMYMIKIYRENTVENFEAMPIFAENEEEAKQAALALSLGKNKIIKIEVVK